MFYWDSFYYFRFFSAEMKELKKSIRFELVSVSMYKDNDKRKENRGT